MSVGRSYFVFIFIFIPTFIPGFLSPLLSVGGGLAGFGRSVVWFAVGILRNNILDSAVCGSFVLLDEFLELNSQGRMCLKPTLHCVICSLQHAKYCVQILSFHQLSPKPEGNAEHKN